MPERINELIFDNFNNIQIDFAKHMGYAQSTVNAWCLGKRSPHADAIIDICKEFNVSADWLLGLSDRKELE